MIQLLFLVLFAEGAVAFLLMVEIGPLRELAVRGLDQLKTGKGSATVKTLAITLSVILLSSITSILKIQNRGIKMGTVTPMDQVLWRTHLLEASLIGFSLFLALVIDRLHYYLRELITLKEVASSSKEEIEKLEKKHVHFKEMEAKTCSELRKLQEEVVCLTEKLQNVKIESEGKEKKTQSAEAHVVSLQKQMEELLLEYDRLLEDNQVLQTQALSFRS